MQLVASITLVLATAATGYLFHHDPVKALATSGNELGFVRCKVKESAYGAAFLTSAAMLVNTSFEQETEEMAEVSGWDMFLPGRRALKTKPRQDFFVEHLSGLEFHVTLANAKKSGERYLDEVGKKAAGYCDHLGSRSDAMSSSLVLIPYWGGFGGSGHSKATPETKLQHLMGTVCTSGVYFQDILVGVCKGSQDKQRLSKINIPLPVQVVELECKAGLYLPSRLLQHVQAQIKAGVLKQEFIYYTEMDQLLHARRSMHDLAAAIKKDAATYFLPNRFEETYLGHGEERGPVEEFNGKRFVDANNCDF